MAIEESKIYEESCAAFRHYSTAVMNIRMLVFAQGFVVLTGVGYLINGKEYLWALFSSIFGMGFTTILAMIQWSYYNHANNILKFLLSFEVKVSSNQEDYGPWNVYAREKNKRYESKFCKALIVYGPYLLFLVAFAILLIWTFVLHVSKN
jgi:hypothetical protein